MHPSDTITTYRSNPPRVKWEIDYLSLYFRVLDPETLTWCGESLHPLPLVREWKRERGLVGSLSLITGVIEVTEIDLKRSQRGFNSLLVGVLDKDRQIKEYLTFS